MGYHEDGAAAARAIFKEGVEGSAWAIENGYADGTVSAWKSRILSGETTVHGGWAYIQEHHTRRSKRPEHPDPLTALKDALTHDYNIRRARKTARRILRRSPSRRATILDLFRNYNVGLDRAYQAGRELGFEPKVVWDLIRFAVVEDIEGREAREGTQTMFELEEPAYERGRVSYTPAKQEPAEGSGAAPGVTVTTMLCITNVEREFLRGVLGRYKQEQELEHETAYELACYENAQMAKALIDRIDSIAMRIGWRSLEGLA